MDLNGRFGQDGVPDDLGDEDTDLDQGQDVADPGDLPAKPALHATLLRGASPSFVWVCISYERVVVYRRDDWSVAGLGTVLVVVAAHWNGIVVFERIRIFVGSRRRWLVAGIAVGIFRVFEGRRLLLMWKGWQRIVFSSVVVVVVARIVVVVVGRHFGGLCRR